MSTIAQILYTLAEATLLTVGCTLIHYGRDWTGLFCGALAVVLAYIEGCESRRYV